MENTGTKDRKDDRTTWTGERLALWRRLAAHPFEPEGQVLPFVRRLARDRDWTLEYARGAVEEYRRFCFLAVTSRTPMTPSEEVDEVWHQHLTYTRDYWDRWCGGALGVPLHHDPTAGGPAEGARFREQYAETLARYEGFFGLPPARYWPATRVRFGAVPRFRTVDRARAIVLPRPPGLPGLRGLLARCAAVLGLVLLLLAAPGQAVAAGLPANPLDWPGEPFLLLYAALAAVAVLGAVGLRRAPRGPWQAGPVAGLGALELAYLAGGPTRVADTVLVGMLAAGRAELDKPGSRVFVTDGTVRLPEDLNAFRLFPSGPVTRKEFKARSAERVARVREGLAARGLVPTDRQLQGLALLTVGLVAPVLLLGLAKVFVGLERDRPVGFLLLLLMVTGAAALWLLLDPPISTQAGRRALAEHKERLGRLVRAPREGELHLAFALVGPLVLLGTPFEAFRSFAAQPGSGGDSSGGGGCSSSDGGGSGGGGCGGCSG